MSLPTPVEQHPPAGGVDASAVPQTRTIVIHALVALAISATAAAAIVWVPFLAPIREHFDHTDPVWIVAAFGFQFLSMASFIAALRGAFEGRVGWRDAFDVATIEESANVVLSSGGSGGIAIGAVLLIRTGVPTRFAVTRSVILFLATSATGLAAISLFGLLEWIGALPGDTAALGTLLPAAIAAAIIVFAAYFPRLVPRLRTDRGGRLRRLAAKGQGTLVDSIDIGLGMVLGGDALLILGSIGYFAFDCASMAASFEALGGGAPALGLFVLAYTIGHAGSVVPLPGAAEGGLVGALVVYGSPLSLAAGGVLVYRTIHIAVPFMLAVIGLLDLRRHGRGGGGDGEHARPCPQRPISTSPG
jgi:uncharacterized membrane protein YbhN (UPF0104 family)